MITKATTQTSLAVKPLVTVKNALVTQNVSIATNRFGDQPTGTVTFFDGGNSLGTVNIAAATDPNTGLVSATANLMTSKLPNGANHLTAMYSGDSNYVNVDGGHCEGELTPARLSLGGGRLGLRYFGWAFLRSWATEPVPGDRFFAIWPTIRRKFDTFRPSCYPNRTHRKGFPA